MKQAVLALAVLMLAGCGTHVVGTGVAASGAAIEAQAAAANKVTATDKAAAIKLINQDFIDKHFEKAPGGGYWIPNPSEEGDGVIVKKVSSGYKNWVFTPTEKAHAFTWTADQDCLDQDMDPFTVKASGTVDLTTKVVTYK